MNNDVKEQLRLARLKRVEDVRDITAARTPQEKRELVSRWNKERHPHTVTELLEIARNPRCWNVYLNWDVDNFKGARDENALRGQGSRRSKRR